MSLQPEVCPTCGQKKRSKYGAAQALKWKKLPPLHTKILSSWLGSEYVFKDLTKDAHNLPIFEGLGLHADSINGRFSEMKARELLKVPTKGHYRLNVPLVIQVLNDGGKLPPPKDHELEQPEDSPNKALGSTEGTQYFQRQSLGAGNDQT